MNLLLQQAQQPPTMPPPPPALPPSLPMSLSGPSLIPSITHPLRGSSGLVFDEYGCPTLNVRPTPTMSDASSSISGLPHTIPHAVSTGPLREHTLGTQGMSPHNMGPTGERIWHPGADYRLRKLKMPLFDGDDAYGWVFRVERFFDIQGLLTTGERLRAAVICLEGEALAWFRWSDKRMPFRTWEQLKAGLLDRFQPSHNRDLYEQFLTLKQDGTAKSYVSRFESMAAQLDGVSERVMEGTFLKGLRPNLRASVRVLQPNGLGQAMKLALMIDENGSGSSGDQPRPTQKTGSTRSFGGPGVRPPVAGPTGVSRSPTGEARQPFRRMTATELNDKRAKGLCFRCDGKFGPGHRCPDKTLQVLVMHEDEQSDEEEIPEGEHAHLDVIEVSAHSVAGITTPHTMKLRGAIRERPVVVLIDSGATHNFLSLRLVGALGLSISGSRETGVMMGNGKTEQSYGICRDVELIFPGIRVVEDFYPL